MTYKEINPGEWKYEEDGDFIEGILVSIKREVGPNKAMLYSIDNGTILNVWGSTILDSKLCFGKIGDKVKITYKGLGEKKQGQNAPKIFKVEIDSDNNQ